MQEVTISLQEDGSLVIPDKDLGNVVIDPSDLEGSRVNLDYLDDLRLAVITKMVDEYREKFTSDFKQLIDGIAVQKNVVRGNISNVGSVTIGDQTHHHYHPEKPRFPKELTARVPRISSDFIIGREEELADIRARLFDQRQVVLVNGLGGIGKTTLAQAYIVRNWDDYRHVAWVGQVSDDIMGDFITAEGLLDNLNIRTEGKEPWSIFLNLVNELKKFDEGPNLLALDNADNSLSRLREYLPGPPWHILATSRERIPEFDVRELDFLSEEDAVALFSRHYTLGNLSNDDIRELVTTVDLHTLTIEILARTGQRHRLGMESLKEALNTDQKAGVHINHKGATIDRITSYLCSIFNFSNLSEDELWMLSQFVCLPPEFHRYELLKDLVRPEVTNREEIFPETLADLTDNGWLLRNEETDSYKMHAIVAKVMSIQRGIDFDDVEPLIKSIASRLSIDQAKDNPVDKFPWISFGESLLMVFPDEREDVKTSLQNTLALVLRDLGRYARAKEWLERAVASAEKNFGADRPSTVVYYSNLALVLRDRGEYEEAKELLVRVVDSDEKNYGVDHRNTVVSYSNLATVLNDLGEYAKAKELLERAVDFAEKNFGADHRSTVLYYSNLAMVLKELGEYAKAKELLERAVASDEKNFGVDHPSTVVNYSNLALVLRALVFHRDSITG